jgi:metal-responsive CopG/Arc/MetJ family transcriptional regulator
MYMNNSNLVRVNVMLDQDELAQLDAKAASTGTSRSSLLREAVRFYLTSGAQGGHRAVPKSEKEIADILAEARRLAELNRGWDGLAELRRWRDRA